MHAMRLSFTLKDPGRVNRKGRVGVHILRDGKALDVENELLKHGNDTRGPLGLASHQGEVVDLTLPCLATRAGDIVQVARHFLYRNGFISSPMQHCIPCPKILSKYAYCLQIRCYAGIGGGHALHLENLRLIGLFSV
jgi:hypothetical protein